jgi:hypothetical protein
MNRGVTMIEDLPSLEDIDYKNNRGNYANDEYPTHINNQTAKYIRGTHQMNPDSGMDKYGHPMQQQEMYHEYRQQASHDHNYPHEKVEQYENSPPKTLNCLDVVNHVESCPICSRFYNNNNKNIYIIIIVILSIFCLLLLKRVLNI